MHYLELELDCFVLYASFRWVPPRGARKRTGKDGENTIEMTLVMRRGKVSANNVFVISSRLISATAHKILIMLDPLISGYRD